jgi:hypothetical protein
MYLPAVPPTLVLTALASFILNAENGKPYYSSRLQLKGEFMMYPVDFHQPSTLLFRVRITTTPDHCFFSIKVLRLLY